MSDAYAALVRFGLVEGDGEQARATPRFRAARARAAKSLVANGFDDDDLRLPVARALLELHPELDDDRVAALVIAALPVAVRDLAH